MKNWNESKGLRKWKQIELTNKGKKEKKPL